MKTGNFYQYLCQSFHQPEKSKERLFLLTGHLTFTVRRGQFLRQGHQFCNVCFVVLVPTPHTHKMHTHIQTHFHALNLHSHILTPCTRDVNTIETKEIDSFQYITLIQNYVWPIHNTQDRFESNEIIWAKLE